MKRLALALPVILILIISGCVIPGTGITIPGIPNIFGPQVKEYESDIVIIRSLEAIPSSIKTGQQIRLISYIQNIGTESVSSVDVDLFDYCSKELFKEVEVKCPGTPYQDSETKCAISNMLPQETVEVDWILTPSDKIELETVCDLKVSSDYQYETTGLTTIHFINSKELQRQLNEGKFSPTTSYIAKGQGPIKAFIEVDDQQPISTVTGDAYTTVSLKLENRGSGFLASHPGYVHIKEVDFGDLDRKDCKFKAGDDIKLIKGKSSALPCDVKIPTDDLVPKETTKQMTVKVSYVYEFRKSAKVTVDKRETDQSPPAPTPSI